LTQNTVDKKSIAHEVKVSEVASKSSHVKMELKQLRQSRKENNIVDYEKTEDELDEEREITKTNEESKEMTRMSKL